MASFPWMWRCPTWRNLCLCLRDTSSFQKACQISSWVQKQQLLIRRCHSTCRFISSHFCCQPDISPSHTDVGRAHGLVVLLEQAALGEEIGTSKTTSQKTPSFPVMCRPPLPVFGCKAGLCTFCAPAQQKRQITDYQSLIAEAISQANNCLAVASGPRSINHSHVGAGLRVLPLVCYLR